MDTKTTFQLDSCQFEHEERILLEHATLQVSLFRYRSGVCGVRLSNQLGHLVVLPYQGQQIWSMEFAGQRLTMKSIFDEPRDTRDYLSTYGGFMQHCGMTAIGNPGKVDNHPLHGELPNAPYEQAFLHCGSDAKGHYVEIGGKYRHSLAFSYDYIAEPRIRLYEMATTVQITMTVTNLRMTPMEYMYLAHLNFKPIDHGQLYYSAICDAEHVQIREGDLKQEGVSFEHRVFLDSIARQPELLDVLLPSHVLDPELVLYYEYKADEAGWAHTMHLQPNGFAGYVKHRPEQLDKVVRWIVRSGDEEALGMALPATAYPEGYTAEKSKGHIRILQSKEQVTFEMEAGLLMPEHAKKMQKHIRNMML